MTVTAVIPNWNGGERLTRVLDDLFAQTYPVTRVIVIDNASTDGSPHSALRTGAMVRLNDRNTGFAHAVNQGIREAGTELVALVNNDVELDPDWLNRLVSALKADPSLWFATGKILSKRDPTRIDATYDAVSRGRTPWRCGQDRLDSPLWDQPCRIFSAPFTAALFRRGLFDRVGLVSEDFESYLEDVDFGLRCAGGSMEGAYVPEAVARHWGSATLGVWHPETIRRLARNQVYLATLYPPHKWFSSTGWAILVAQLLWGVVALRHGAFLSYCRGKYEGLSRRLEPRLNHRNTQAFFSDQDREIARLQQASGWDAYWKWYFRLTGGSPR